MSDAQAQPKPVWRTPMVVLGAGAMVILLVFGLRASFGLFLTPISVEMGTGREVFAFAMAVQNLLWGAGQPFASAVAEKWGAGRVIVLGGILYAGGIALMGYATDPLTLNLSAGIMIGMAQAASGLAVVLGAVARALPPERRTWGLGVVTAAGALGQCTVVPGIQGLMTAGMEWLPALMILAARALIMLVCAVALAGKPNTEAAAETVAGANPGLMAAIKQASGHRDYWLLTLGFFVCGFHVAFITVHMPSYLMDLGFDAQWGAWSLAIIGFFNIIGSYTAGSLGDKYRKKSLLAYLYIARAFVIIAFISLPVTGGSVLLFSAAMGLLWLSTVPLTSGLVAYMFGPRYMGTLFGIVFFSHQVGSFLGVWLGGYFYDTTGSYDPIWWAGIVVGFGAALVHWPIRENLSGAKPEAA